MSYEPTVWKTGDVVTSNKLNKLENGVANGGNLVIRINVNFVNKTSTLDKTWQEIYDAVVGGKYVCVIQGSSDTEMGDISIYPISSIIYSSSEFHVVINNLEYSTNTREGHPQVTIDIGGGTQ